FSEDCDEEREMEPKPEPHREATQTIRPRSPVVRKQRERVMGFEEAPNREGSRRGRNAEGTRKATNLRPLYREATNSRLTWGDLPLNNTLLSHHAQPFIPSSLHTPTGIVPIHVNPHSQPYAGLINGQTLNLPFQT
ncbi:hypothetical protein Tco_0293446, partial [Tanacetum coccineum]